MGVFEQKDRMIAQNRKPARRVGCLAWWGVCVGLAAALGGCAPAVVPRLSAGGDASSVGGVVGGALFLPTETRRALGGVEAWEFEEYARRDGALAVAGPTGALTASDQWPRAAQPTLERSRQVRNPFTSSGDFVIYVPPPRWHEGRRYR